MYGNIFNKTGGGSKGIQMYNIIQYEMLCCTSHTPNGMKA